MNKIPSCVKDIVWIHLKVFYVTAHQLPFSSHDVPVANCFSLGLKKISPTDTPLTVWILTCTYKGQTVPLVNRSEKSSSNKSLWKEVNLQIAKHAALWSQFWQLTKYLLLSLLSKNTNMSLKVNITKGKQECDVTDKHPWEHGPEYALLFLFCKESWILWSNSLGL